MSLPADESRPERTRIRRRRWPWIAAAVLVAAIAASWYAARRVRYTAVATLRVAMHPKSILPVAGREPGDPAEYKRTQEALLTDRSVISYAITRLAASAAHVHPDDQEQPDPEDWLEKELRVEFVGGSEVMRVSLSGDRPKDIADIVNQMIDSYMELVVDAGKQGSAQLRRTKLEELSERIPAEIEGQASNPRSVSRSPTAWGRARSGGTGRGRGGPIPSIGPRGWTRRDRDSGADGPRDPLGGGASPGGGERAGTHHVAVQGRPPRRARWAWAGR